MIPTPVLLDARDAGYGLGNDEECCEKCEYLSTRFYKPYGRKKVCDRLSMQVTIKNRCRYFKVKGVKE